MLVEYLLVAIVTLITKISGQTNCEQPTALFGSTKIAIMVDDVALLRSNYDQPSMTVSAINVCGTFGNLNGIQFFLNNTKGQTLTLNAIGEASNCTKWTIPVSQYIESVYLTYNTGGPTSFKITTNTGTTYSVGSANLGDLLMS